VRSRPPKPKVALDQAAHLLARRDHSRRELHFKLTRQGVCDAEAQSALDQLENRGFLNDERFCESYIRVRRERGIGPLRISAELRTKGVAAEMIERHIMEHAPHWLAEAEKQYRKRFGRVASRSRQESAGRVRFLLQRGFPSETVFKAMKLADDSSDHD
jgi:regulatory protein